MCFPDLTRFYYSFLGPPYQVDGVEAHLHRVGRGQGLRGGSGGTGGRRIEGYLFFGHASQRPASLNVEWITLKNRKMCLYVQKLTECWGRSLTIFWHKFTHSILKAVK